MFDANASVEITRDLLIALGLEVQNGTNLVYDQENKSGLLCDGLFIKANTDINKALSITERDIKLEPLNPKCTKIMEFLFGKFLDDSEELENTAHCLAYYFDKLDVETPEDRKYRLTIKFADGTVWVGNWYYNKIISYLEAIFALDGTFADKDLRIYDIPQIDDNWE